VISVKVPTLLRGHTGGEPVVEGEGGTLGDLLKDLESRHPGLTAGLVGEDGSLPRHVNLYLNGEDVRYLGSLATEVHDGDVVSVLPAVAGG
jgi:MoaD family protein